MNATVKIISFIITKDSTYINAASILHQWEGFNNEEESLTSSQDTQ